MAEIDYVTIAIISGLNTLMALTVTELFHLFREWRKRVYDELKRRSGNGKNGSDDNVD